MVMTQKATALSYLLTCRRKFWYVCTDTNVYRCVYPCLCVCVFVCVCVMHRELGWSRVCKHTTTHTHTHTHKSVFMYADLCVCVCTNTHTTRKWGQ
jgi:hypothetical protein